MKTQGQKEILQAISDVRMELKAASDRGASVAIEITPILTRLATLYSLLDVESLAQVIEAPQAQVVDLAQYRQKKAA